MNIKNFAAVPERLETRPLNQHQNVNQPMNKDLGIIKNPDRFPTTMPVHTKPVNLPGSSEVGIARPEAKPAVIRPGELPSTQPVNTNPAHQSRTENSTQDKPLVQQLMTMLKTVLALFMSVISGGNQAAAGEQEKKSDAAPSKGGKPSSAKPETIAKPINDNNSAGKKEILDDASVSADKNKILSDSKVGLAKTRILADASVSTDKSKILADPKVSLEKTRMLADASVSVDKAKILADPKVSVEQTRKLASANISVDEAKKIVSNNSDGKVEHTLTEKIKDKAFDIPKNFKGHDDKKDAKVDIRDIKKTVGETIKDKEKDESSNDNKIDIKKFDIPKDKNIDTEQLKKVVNKKINAEKTDGPETKKAEPANNHSTPTSEFKKHFDTEGLSPYRSGGKQVFDAFASDVRTKNGNGIRNENKIKEENRVSNSESNETFSATVTPDVSRGSQAMIAQWHGQGEGALVKLYVDDQSGDVQTAGAKNGRAGDGVFDVYTVYKDKDGEQHRINHGTIKEGESIDVAFDKQGTEFTANVNGTSAEFSVIEDPEVYFKYGMYLQTKDPITGEKEKPNDGGMEILERNNITKASATFEDVTFTREVV